MSVTEAQKRATAKYEKENYDKVLVRFPKGTKERIQNTGAKSVNSYIIQCVLDSLATPRKTEKEMIKERTEEIPPEQPKPHKVPTLNELQEWQAILSAKKAAQDKQAAELQAQKEERERLEKEANTAELMRYVERIRNGEQTPEDAEKEQMRQESIIKAGLPY